jgi:hypothetical protein
MAKAVTARALDAVAHAEGKEAEELKRAADEAVHLEKLAEEEALAAEADLDAAELALDIEAIVRIQSAWRSRREWTFVQRLARSLYEELYDDDHGAYYYYHKRSGVTSWTRPWAFRGTKVHKQTKARKHAPATPHDAALRIQVNWRCRQARRQLCQLTKLVYEKIHELDAKGNDVWYYYHTVTGESHWIKPKFLGSDDIMSTPRLPDRPKKAPPASEDEACSRIQHAWRCALARHALVCKVKKWFQKFFDEDFNAYFYYNRRTGTSSWRKPKILRSDDLLLSPREPGKSSPREQLEEPSHQALVARLMSVNFQPQ